MAKEMIELLKKAILSELSDVGIVVLDKSMFDQVLIFLQELYKEQPEAGEFNEIRKILERGKRTYEKWRDWYKQNPDSNKRPSAELFAGNLAHQEQWIIDYSKVLTYIDRQAKEFATKNKKIEQLTIELEHKLVGHS